jgi:ABC-type phosphate transport system substrate-binding protein
MGGAQEVGTPQASDTSMVDAVAHTPGAIGYVAVTSLNPTVKAINLNGVSAWDNLKTSHKPIYFYTVSRKSFAYFMLRKESL